MKFHIRAKKIPGADLATEHVRRRLGFALGRFADRVAKVHVTLEDVNGPRGGIDKRCSMRAVLRSGGEPLIAVDLDGSIAVAIDRAAERLARRVARVLRRRRRRRYPSFGAGVL